MKILIFGSLLLAFLCNIAIAQTDFVIMCVRDADDVVVAWKRSTDPAAPGKILPGHHRVVTSSAQMTPQTTSAGADTQTPQYRLASGALVLRPHSDIIAERAPAIRRRFAGELGRLASELSAVNTELSASPGNVALTAIRNRLQTRVTELRGLITP